MNVPFTIPSSADAEKEFVAEAAKLGMVSEASAQLWVRVLAAQLWAPVPPGGVRRPRHPGQGPSCCGGGAQTPPAAPWVTSPLASWNPPCVRRQWASAVEELQQAPPAVHWSGPPCAVTPPPRPRPPPAAAAAAGPAQGPPQRGRHARLHLQLHAPGGRAAAGGVHEGLCRAEGLSPGLCTQRGPPHARLQAGPQAVSVQQPAACSRWRSAAGGCCTKVSMLPMVPSWPHWREVIAGRRVCFPAGGGELPPPSPPLVSSLLAVFTLPGYLLVLKISFKCSTCAARARQEARRGPGLARRGSGDATRAGRRCPAQGGANPRNCSG